MNLLDKFILLLFVHEMEKENESQIMGEKINGGALVALVEHEQATENLYLKL